MFAFLVAGAWGSPGSLRRSMAFTETVVETHRPHVRVERLPGAAFFPDQAFETPTDPKPREHVFVVGAETSGTRLVAKMLAADLGIPDARKWDGAFADADAEDVVFHVSLPWGGVCEDQRVEPTIPTWGAQYSGLNAFVSEPRGHPDRFNLDVQKLLDTYAAKGEKIQVVLVARDPEVSLRGKIAAHHCSNRKTALDEQGKAFELLRSAPKRDNVHTVCYEDLVAKPAETLQPVRAALHVQSTVETAMQNGNDKYRDLPAVYECTAMLASYVQMCPHTALAKQYANCTA